MQGCADFLARVMSSEADVIYRDGGVRILPSDCDRRAYRHSRVASRRGDDKLNASIAAVACELTVGRAIQSDSATEDEVADAIQQFVRIGPNPIL